MTEPHTEDIAHRAHRAAVQHLQDLTEAMWAEEDGADIDWAELGATAPYDGCDDCVVREVATTVIAELEAAGPGVGAPASTETARNGDLSDDRADQAPVDPPTPERTPTGDLDEAVWHQQFEKEKARAEKAETERDGWKAKHAAFRADVDRLQREHKALPAMWDFVDALGHDAARAPQADPDTVTLRRDDVEALAEVWHQYAWGPGEAETTARVRAALGWGDSDDA